MKPVELCESSPSERRPRIRPSRPPTCFDFSAPKTRASASNISDVRNADRKGEVLSQSSRNGGTSTSATNCRSASSPEKADDSRGGIRDILAEGRSRTPLAASSVVERLHRGESSRHIHVRQPRFLSASQSMPDLPSEIEVRESRQSRALRVLRCRKAVRDWIERQWMRRHGKEVEPRINEKELMQYKQMFSMLDADGSGNLDVDELQSAMRFIGMKVPTHELRERIAVVDVSRDGLIDMPEFVQLMAKGTFEGFDVSAQRERDHKRATAEDDSIVTGAPRRRQSRSKAANGEPKQKPKPKPKEPLMADLPFFLWIPAYHRRRTMASLMQGKVVPDLENLSVDSYAPYEHLDEHRAEKVVKDREDALTQLSFAQRRRVALPAAGARRRKPPRVASSLKYEPPTGLPEPYSKAKPSSLVRAETRLHRGMGFSRSRRPRITDLRVQKAPSSTSSSRNEKLGCGELPRSGKFSLTNTLADVKHTQSCVPLL